MATAWSLTAGTKRERTGLRRALAAPPPACATLGGHSLERVARALASCSRVYLAMDMDRAGQEASERLSGQLGPRALPIHLPPGFKDVGELAVHPRGRDLFLDLLVQVRRLDERRRYRALEMTTV